MSNRIAFAALGLAAVMAGCQANEPPPPPTPRPVVEEPEPEAPPAPSTVKVGVVIPASSASDLAEYAVLIREGIDLAVAEYDSAGGPALEVVERDDGGSPLRAARAVQSLEAEGAVAVIGPLVSESLEAATASRGNADLVLLSPTATEAPIGAAHAYSLNAVDSQGDAALARWAVASGMLRLAVFYATSDEDAGRARGFSDVARSLGAEVVAQVPFDPGTTTFEAPVKRLVRAEPQAVFIAASTRDLRQLVPQLAYYGLKGVQILGGASWLEPELLRSVPAMAVEGAVVATPLESEGADTGWNDFVALYERTYRRSLDNPYPALGYDAAKLILREIAQGRTRPDELARALSGIRDYRGATGVLSIENGRISRRPFLVRIRSGRPEPLSFRGSPE